MPYMYVWGIIHGMILIALLFKALPTDVPCKEYGLYGGLECVTMSDGTTVCYSQEVFDHEEVDSNTNNTGGS